MNKSTYNDSIPEFSDKRKLKKVWVKNGNKERVFIYESDNGIWGLYSQIFSDHEAEMCWGVDDIGGHYFDSEKTAIIELFASFPWAKEVGAINL